MAGPELDAKASKHSSGALYAAVSCSENHCVALTLSGSVVSWATHPSGNRFGQLCQGAAERSLDVDGQQPAPVDTLRMTSSSGRPLQTLAAEAGGNRDTGHTVLLTEDGGVWTCGCDRWQQLGLSGGSPSGSAAGYTWPKGRIWQTAPQEVTALRHQGISAVQAAAGADHSVVLASNRQDVYTWGRGEHGQLGRGENRGPFLAAPGRSPVLSAGPGAEVERVLADGNCSAAIHRPSGGGAASVVSVGSRCKALLSAASNVLAASDNAG